MIQLTASLYNPGSTTDIQNLRHMTKTSQSKSKHKSTSCHAELVCSTACLSCLNSLAHFKRPSIFHGASIMLALLQLSPLSHINSSPTSFKRKKKNLSYPVLPKTPPSFTTHRLLLTYQAWNCHLFLLTYEENKSRPKKTSPQESSVFLH